MFNISDIQAVCLDISGSNTSYARQDEITNLAWFLLDSNYQIYLFSSNQKEDLTGEKFQHPRLQFMPQPMPPVTGAAQLEPLLLTGNTLWVSDSPDMHSWFEAHDLKFAYSRSNKAFGSRGLRIGSLGDLVALFNTRAQVLREVGAEIVRRRNLKGGGPYLVGVAGPPLSQYQQFTVDLKGVLEALDCPVVDLLEMSSLLWSSEGQGDPLSAQGPWRTEAACHWFSEEILRPLHQGNRVFLETLPDGVPRDFEVHLPLFLSEDSVVLLLGTMILIPAITEKLDSSVLLEVSIQETTRRVYEIPASETFDEKFLTQYLAHEGGRYKSYMEAHKVKQNATLRVNAERPHALVLSHVSPD